MNVHDTIKTINNMWIGSYKIRANLARTYVEVTKGAPEKSSMIFNTGEVIPNWLSRSCASVLCSFDLIPDMDSIINAKFNTAEARVLGGHQMVITFPSMHQKLATLNGEFSDWLGQYFEVWKDWSHYDIAEGRFTWLKILRVEKKKKHDQVKVQVDQETYDIFVIEDGIQDILFPKEDGIQAKSDQSLKNIPIESRRKSTIESFELTS
ncbi:hypothetical protein ACFE04_009059 [Oxalis oulophora]